MVGVLLLAVACTDLIFGEEGSESGPRRRPLTEDSSGGARRDSIGRRLSPGDLVCESLCKRYSEIQSDSRLLQVEEVVRRLAQGNGRGGKTWRIHLFEGPEISNALGVPPDQLFLWEGVFDIATNEEELAVVLAHVMAHVEAGHYSSDPAVLTREILWSVSAETLQNAGRFAPRVGVVGSGLGTIGRALEIKRTRSEQGRVFSLGNESSADEMSIRLLADAGYDPKAVLFFWSKAASRPVFEEKSAYFLLHPPSSERLQRMEGMLLEIERAEAERRDLGAWRGVERNTWPHARVERPSGDSFDIDRGRPSAPAELLGQHPGPALSESAWRVRGAVAVVFSAPDTASRALGELRQGAVVRSIGTSGDWVEIETPDHGFIHRVSLEKLK